MRGGFAIVTKVLPERHGVLVSFNDGASSIDTGDESGHFVRVLARRSHPNGGATIELPQVGELGLVVELDDLHQIWVGGIHWQEDNQVDPTPGLSMDRHTSGIRSQRRPNGDMQLDHPSGLRVTVAGQPGALSDLSRKGEAGPQPPKGDCHLEVAHPSGASLTVDKDGALEVVLPAGGKVAVDKDGHFEASGFASMKLQDANARFCMEDLLTWVKDHKHTSAASGSPTSAPTTQPPATSLSPDTFMGPHA